jgi:hypothetical protein
MINIRMKEAVKAYFKVIFAVRIVKLSKTTGRKNGYKFFDTYSNWIAPQHMPVAIPAFIFSSGQSIFKFHLLSVEGSRDSSVAQHLAGCGLDDWGFESQRELRIVFYTTRSRPALGSN